MKRWSAFEFYVRTGRRIAEHLETKFNPWHDPNDGRFTFAGQGMSFGRDGSGRAASSKNPTRGVSSGGGRSSPPARPVPARTARLADKPSKTNANPMMRLARSVKPLPPSPSQDSATPLASGAAAAQRMSQEAASVGRVSLRPVPNYPEQGSSSWRASNDRIFIGAAKQFNEQRGLRPGDPKHVDPLLMNAWAMVESGGSKSSFLRDPLQVNNPPDWTDLKGRVTGITKNQPMTPTTSVDAALKWLEFRGYFRDKAGQPGPWRGYGVALRRYNGRSRRHSSGVPHSVWYANEVLKLYVDTKRSQ